MNVKAHCHKLECLLIPLGNAPESGWLTRGKGHRCNMAPAVDNWDRQSTADAELCRFSEQPLLNLQSESPLEIK